MEVSLFAKLSAALRDSYLFLGVCFWDLTSGVVGIEVLVYEC